jgi:hypothetical protein
MRGFINLRIGFWRLGTERFGFTALCPMAENVEIIGGD